jgi:formylglycine-generating enzyme required for sulfatase activity
MVHCRNLLSRAATRGQFQAVTAFLLVAAACHPPESPPPQGPPPAKGDLVAIPGGTFLMGSPDNVGAKQEHPQHKVTLNPFQLDRTLVTVNAYDACVRGGSCSPAGNEQRGTPGAGPEQNAFCNGSHPDRGDHPINCVDFSQATAYCASQGERLPTEEEWEYVARGPSDRTYPWGEDAPAGQLCWNRLRGEDYAHAEGTCPVGAHPSGDSPFGIADIVGNVWEWTSSVLTVPYGGQEDNTARVVRGGGWRDSEPSEVRGANRNASNLPDRVVNLGFRCAR